MAVVTFVPVHEIVPLFVQAAGQVTVLPADVEMRVIRDQSRFIRRSLDEVSFHLVLGAILVALTTFFFLHDWRGTVIASIAIPASIISSFVLMRAMGYTLNNFTMLGLVFAVGIVIDDAIVVLENIHRTMEEKGWDGKTAASFATREIALAVMATTLSLVVIFLPLAFMKGRVGMFFSSYGVTVAFAILVSLFVSFTLTPMLASRFLRHTNDPRLRDVTVVEVRASKDTAVADVFVQLHGSAKAQERALAGLEAARVAAYPHSSRRFRTVAIRWPGVRKMSAIRSASSPPWVPASTAACCCACAPRGPLGRFRGFSSAAVGSYSSRYADCEVNPKACIIRQLGNNRLVVA